MKRVLLITGLAVGILSCGDSNNTQTGTTTTLDSSTHSNHQTDGTATGAGIADTAASSGQSMMSLMQANMDQMKAVQSTGNPDNDFAALMKVHHMGALEMAQLEVAQGQNQELKAMAQKMIDAQQREIAELNTFLSGHQAHGGGQGFYNEVMGQMNNMKMDMNHSGSVDQQFAQMMIPHHQGAIEMSRAYLKSGAHEERLKSMANKIIADQQKEIQQLQAWLNSNKS